VEFSSYILHWYHNEHRDFPWRATKNVYKIWLSEIILQQTRTSQGLSYYTKFTDIFPTLKDLAITKEEKVLKLWQGLGYYSRARNLHTTAKHIHYNLEGVFPNNYEELLKLKGVGPYTAAAISSICFNEKRAAIDGNVYRILARVFDIHTAINSTKGIKIFQKLANSLICETNPGDYNQGLMDLGATICTPKKPDCNNCPLNSICIARSKKIITKLPIKIKATKVKERYLNYFCIEHKGQFLMNKREGDDIWKNLYDFPLKELHVPNNNNSTHDKKITKDIIGGNSFSIKKSVKYKHKLSHQKLNITIHHIITNQAPRENNYIKISQKQALELPVPKPIEKFFQELFNPIPLDNER